MNTICKEKHTRFKPTPEQWKCPKCGTGNDPNSDFESPSFYIDDGPNLDCELLHMTDAIICTGCDTSWTGKRLAEIMMKKLEVVICPHCNGTGFISGDLK